MGSLMRQELESLLGAVRQVTRLAAEKIKEIYQQYLSGGDIGISEKAKDDPVTAADMAANQIMAQRLRAIFPDHAILTKENPVMDKIIWASRKVWGLI